MRNLFLIFCGILSLISCNEPSNSKRLDSGKKSTLQINRFEIDFYTASPKTLKQVQQKYPKLFAQGTPDSIWLQKLKNPKELKLFQETQKKFSNSTTLEIELAMLFANIKRFFPNFQSPSVTTLINNLDFKNRIIFDEQSILISLDCYLGSDHEFYSNVPNYIKKQFESETLVVDVAKSIINMQFYSIDSDVFLEKMINAGKIQYLLHQYLPKVADGFIMGYTPNDFQWAQENEVFIWKYFNEQKLLNSEDPTLNHRFLDFAPFSQFYREEDHDSPGRIGVWMGWQIVTSFMNHNDVSLQGLMGLSPSEIFKKSKYKPNKYGN